MKKILLLSGTLFFTFSLLAQSEVELRTDGIVIPRTTPGTIQSPVEGMVTYNSSIQRLQYYNGSQWKDIDNGTFERVGSLIRSSISPVDNFIFGLDTMPTGSTGFSERYFFYNQLKGAFRGGSSEDNSWVQDSLGSHSFAYGRSARARGIASVAFNKNSVAFGDNSAAFGLATNARAKNSVAFGNFTRARGDNSAAFGNLTNAKGKSSVVFGRATNAIGENSAAFGSFTNANGKSSAAFGMSTNANGENSAAFGNLTDATARNSAAFGKFTDADGENSAAFGDGTRADAINSAAFGDVTTAFGENSSAFGYRSSASGTNSFASGESSIAYGVNCAAFGQYSDAIVSVNDSVIGTSPLFIVGNGNGFSSRSNALAILKNGEVSFYNYTFPINDGVSGQVLTANGNHQLSWAQPPDISSTNEIQTLSKSGNIVTLSNGGGDFMDEDDWDNVNDDIYYTAGKVGIGENAPDTRMDIKDNGTGETSGIELTNANGVFKAHLYQDASGNLILRKGNSPNQLVLVGGRTGVNRVPTSSALEVEGNASKTTAGNWAANSDRRIKTDVQEIELQGISYLNFVL